MAHKFSSTYHQVECQRATCDNCRKEITKEDIAKNGHFHCSIDKSDYHNDCVANLKRKHHGLAIQLFTTKPKFKPRKSEIPVIIAFIMLNANGLELSRI